MKRTLKSNEKVLVTLEGDGRIRKEVLCNRRSGFIFVPPEVSVEREIRALKMIKKVQDVPKFIRKGPGPILYMNYIEGTSLLDTKMPVPDKYSDELHHLIKKTY